MELTTLCYIEKDGKYLMLHRVKKKQDLNKGKYIGVGGHFEKGESPDECLIREVREETGLKLSKYRARGIVTFLYGEDTVEYMHLYTADKFTGKLTDSDEGELLWVPKDEIMELNLWEGDRIFLKLLQEDAPFFSLKLVYNLKDELTSAILNGKELLKKSASEQKRKTGNKQTKAKAKTAADIAEDSTSPSSPPTREILKDKDIREPLFDFLEETYGKIRILEEKTVGKSRADVVMVTPDALFGIEIKSDADTYTRLSDQVKDYDKYFDYNIVVVGSSHGEHTHEHVPPYWGIITVEIVDGTFDFYILRKPQENPKVKCKKKLELLWRPELAQIQEWNRMPKYKNLSRAHAVDKILELMPELISESTLKKQVSDILFERDYSKVKETLNEYRKGEIEKQLEKETDPEKRMELLTRKANAGKNLIHASTRKYRRKRKA